MTSKTCRMNKTGWLTRSKMVAHETYSEFNANYWLAPLYASA